MANTFTFIIGGYGIPMIKIENPDSFIDEGYLSIFRNYDIQISRSDKGDMSLGNSCPRPSDFDRLDRETLIRHIKECIYNNHRTVYDFNFNFEDIPDNILETFIKASIDASYHWDEIFRGGYEVRASVK